MKLRKGKKYWFVKVNIWLFEKLLKIYLKHFKQTETLIDLSYYQEYAYGHQVGHWKSFWVYLYIIMGLFLFLDTEEKICWRCKPEFKIWWNHNINTWRVTFYARFYQRGLLEKVQKDAIAQGTIFKGVMHYV